MWYPKANRRRCKMSRWKWDYDPEEILGEEEWAELEEEIQKEEEEHRKRLEEDFYLDFYPEEG